MPDQNTDAAKKLEKLGQRIHDGFAKEHPIPDRSLETVRQTIREQWEKEKTTKTRQPPPPSPTQDRTRKPEEPDQNR